MFHPAYKLVLITEHFLCERISAIAAEEGARGQTWSQVGGKGLHHRHPSLEAATVAEGIDNIRMEILCRQRATAEAIAIRVYEECFREYPGILYLQPIEVLRPERF